MRRYNAKPKKKIFGWVLLGYTLLLALLAALGILYVRGLLVEYEACQPDRQVELVLDGLREKALDTEDFCDTFNVGQLSVSEYEQDIDVLERYLELLRDPATEFALKPGAVAEDEMRYIIRNGDAELAQVLLKAESPLRTKLAVFSMRDWGVAEVIAGPAAKDYTITLPADFSLTVNGMSCQRTDSESSDETCYELKGLYLVPELEILSPDRESANYVIRGQRILLEIYSYSLVLPATLKLTMNGFPYNGTERDDGYISYSIRELEKPDVVISDLYGNSISYEGGSVPMTNMTLLCEEGHTVTVNSASVPDEAVALTVPKKYKIIEDSVSDLPVNMEYYIAVLDEDARVEVKDGNGDPVSLEEGKSYHNLTSLKGTDSIPAEISDSIDVLEVAKNWSLYMSNDFSFAGISAYMLPDSYQYEVAYKYSQSPDRTFFSGHVLLDPAFTDTKVGNFVRITEDCFSVDISFVKHMRLNSNQNVDDAMNDSFYFVRSNGRWLLAGMQEVTDNA
ncbi:MAG: hypothetical protein IKT46_02520 [Clostridia bacterium]|nr:hypothetical protein [Clostridia bacterium]